MPQGIEAWRRQRLPEIVARVFLKEGTRLLVDLCCLPSRPQIRDVSVPFGLQSRDVHGSPPRLLFDARPLGACPRSSSWFQCCIRREVADCCGKVGSSPRPARTAPPSTTGIT